jgi:hypothetical protein
MLHTSVNIKIGEKSLERQPEEDSQPEKPEGRYPLRERKAKVFTDHVKYNAFKAEREPETFSEAKDKMTKKSGSTQSLKSSVHCEKLFKTRRDSVRMNLIK